MAKRRGSKRPPASGPPQSAAPSREVDEQAPTEASRAFPRLHRYRWGIVSVLLAVHYGLAFRSLTQESPTVDEVAHLPAGVTYWEKQTFKLYHHNPPLVKLIASLPVVAMGADTSDLYSMPSWTSESPSQASFGGSFALKNATRFFELFEAARMLMPLFSVLGGIVVFQWSSTLFGTLGGLISVTLWAFCPNVLAHGRLITTDVAAAAFGCGATYLFWKYLKRPTTIGAVAAGLALGAAQLVKFSLLLLYGLWPLLWLAALLVRPDRLKSPGEWRRGAAHGFLVVSLSILVIDAGYFFEGIGKPLGSYEFCCDTLTRDEARPNPPRSQNELLDLSWRHRVNRFRGTLLNAIPVPLPYHYVVGFDEQKIEAEGFPLRWIKPDAGPNETTGYTVYLNGKMSRSGWKYFYAAALAYKVPEGTWLLGLLAVALFLASPRARLPWPDELAVAAMPVVTFFAISFLTDINIGLRYVLPIFPFGFIWIGRAGAWVACLEGSARSRMLKVVGLLCCLTIASSLRVHPHYLAYFNDVSGGPDRGAERLIDSNLDWGQDLPGLRAWLKKNRPGAKVGLAYFGQITPSIYEARGDGFDWFLPPPLGQVESMGRNPFWVGPARALTPGLYAVSASLLKGLPWRLYDPGPIPYVWQSAWNVRDIGAYRYFNELEPIDKIGYSIFLYELSEGDAIRLNRRYFDK